jgi:hypothetical protein
MVWYLSNHRDNFTFYLNLNFGTGISYTSMKGYTSPIRLPQLHL